MSREKSAKRTVRRLIERWLAHRFSTKWKQHPLESIREMGLQESYSGIQQPATKRVGRSVVLISDMPDDVKKVETWLKLVQSYSPDYLDALVARSLHGSMAESAKKLGWTEDKMNKAWHVAFGMVYLLSTQEMDKGMSSSSA